MNATKLLKQQHRQVKNLFKQLKKTEDATVRKQLLGEIARRLQTHMTVEEELFYPAVRDGVGNKKVQEMVPEAYEEHHVVKLVLNELPQISAMDERFEAKMTVLEELIDHHVEEEEREMFKAAQRLGADELDILGQRMERRARSVGGTTSSAADDFDDFDEEASSDRTGEAR